MISINSNVYGVALGHYKYYLRIGRIGENCVGLVTALPPPLFLEGRKITKHSEENHLHVNVFR